MSAELAVTKPLRADGTLEKVREARNQIERSDPSVLAEIIAFSEAVSIAARARAAADLAREAADTRIRALRRFGELIARERDPARKDLLWDVMPEGRGFGRVEELGTLPKRLFERAVNRLLDEGAAATVYAVIRDAKIASLKPVERGVWIAFDGTYWISTGPKKRSYAGDNLEQARRALKLKSDPALKSVDECFAKARLFAQEIERLSQRLSGEPRRIVSEAELLQAKVAELLHKAYLIGDGSA